MTAGRHYILILPPLLSNSETSLPIQRVTCRAFFSRVWGLYDCGNPLLFILLERHVFHAFSMENKEGECRMLRAGSICFPTSCMFTLALTVLTICHRLESLIYSWFIRDQPHSPKPHLRPLDSWERCGRGAVEVCS